MQNFSLQTGTTNFQSPAVKVSFTQLSEAANDAILTAAKASEFTCQLPTPVADPTIGIPDSVYALTESLIRRGFTTQYDGLASSVTVNWAYPDFPYNSFDRMTFIVSPGMLEQLGGWFDAATIYMCMTNGVDLRHIGILEAKRQIQSNMNIAGVQGLNYISWGFPIVPKAVLDNLYAEIFTMLNASGIGVTYNDLTGLYTFTWDPGTEINLFDGSTQTATVS